MLEEERSKTAIKYLVISAISIFLMAFSVPYLITKYSSNSICLLNWNISNQKDKIYGARRYFDEKLSSNLTEINRRRCCRVDKGRGDDPTLSWFAYYAHDKAHYVHLYAAPKISISQKNQGGRDMLITVNSCGRGITHGVDL